LSAARVHRLERVAALRGVLVTRLLCEVCDEMWASAESRCGVVARHAPQAGHDVSPPPAQAR
jgi:hypothetical protein